MSRLKTFKKAWQVAVLKAHGVDPHWRKGSYKDLTAECQQRIREINLHWHDLRHHAELRIMPIAPEQRALGLEDLATCGGGRAA
jgi:hypothetical protein